MNLRIKTVLLAGSMLAGSMTAPVSVWAQAAPSGQPAATTADRVEAGQTSGASTTPGSASSPDATAAQVTAEPGRPPAPTTAGGAQVQELVVTGSRIRSVNLQSAVPITSLSAATFTNTAQISIGDVLNELPALRSTFSTANSTRFIGTAGLNLLDLRGLGTSRTLVLVNGRRHVSASEGSAEVDTNTIPTDLIDRVDVVTGGNSAIYGSDAIAGVVNFQLKKTLRGSRCAARKASATRTTAIRTSAA